MNEDEEERRVLVVDDERSLTRLVASYLRRDGYKVECAFDDVLVDPERIGQVLANLLNNALRHTPALGSVTVDALRGEHGVQFVVTDTGDGIAVEHLPHLFERFYRADNARDRPHGGSGIGLAIVRAVVTAHGGRAEAASAGLGAGATFTIILPAAATPADPHRRHRAPAR